MISVEKQFFQAFPRLAQGHARGLSLPVVSLLRRIVCEQRINQTLAALGPARGLAFVEQALEQLGCRYRVSLRERANIPSEGRVLIVANHPLGALDALALLDLVGSIRRDLRIVANQVLQSLPELGDLLLGCPVLGERGAGAGLREIYRALERDEAVIVFPAGEVSRIRANGIRDGRWAEGFVRFARRTASPVLPVHIAASNSPAFYGASLVAKPLGTMLLPRQMFAKSAAPLALTVGGMVPASALVDPVAQTAARMRRDVYRLARGRSGSFTTIRTIAHPESPQAVRRDLDAAELLGITRDGKRILLLDASEDCAALREIGRLRELAFRQVGEGTGARRDLDEFDHHYRHLLLWSEPEMAIVGAYRLGEVGAILRQRGPAGLYSASLFDYRDSASGFLDQAVELGRSFVHPQHWGSRSLDLLWQGIGAYLRVRPEVRYLFGPVSVPATVPESARQRIAAVHLHYFGHDRFASARRPLALPSCLLAEVSAELAGVPVAVGIERLRRRLLAEGTALPVLYRQYVDLCEPDAVAFADFGVDNAFSACMDGLIRLDLAGLRPAKRARYFGSDAP